MGGGILSKIEESKEKGEHVERRKRVNFVLTIDLPRSNQSVGPKIVLKERGPDEEEERKVEEKSTETNRKGLGRSAYDDRVYS